MACLGIYFSSWNLKWIRWYIAFDNIKKAGGVDSGNMNEKLVALEDIFYNTNALPQPNTKKFESIWNE